ncbi:uncharacterized protein M421DRAFT_6762 [Didymella exigua CBS 183.55]|uniref:Uncharacterized protein n=1 Tax=Didymella exigua CBS 183.55 TaxID=1150837 RepID=A0A6A5RH46_9PLEO|nr:uncharacterized protein M421DRAFT_6762 [Didymella exigua CBS 183.55]KAF1926859.1 hypothetical protein M421DRAFT_6762 [Didymella exigua CBS 183.55]
MAEQQQQAAARGPSPGDINNRLSSLENAKPSIEVTQFVELQSVVQAMKTEATKLDLVPEQLKQLQATVAQYDEKIVGASSENDKLKTEVDRLMSMKEDVKKIKEQQEQQTQGQALRTESIKKITQAVTKPDVARLEAIQTKQQTTIEQLSTKVIGSQGDIGGILARVETNKKSMKDMSTTVDAAQRITNELEVYNLPNSEVLMDKIGQVERHEARAYRKFGTLETDLTRLRDEQKDLNKDIEEFIGLIRARFVETNSTIIQRIVDLEGRAHSLLAEQDRISNHAGKHHITPKDFEELQEVVSGLGEGQEKLVKDVTEIKVIIGELENESPTKSAQGVQADLSKKRNTVIDQLNEIRKEQVSLHSQQKSYQTECDKLSEEQTKFKKISKSLESRVPAFDKTVDQVKVLANAQTDLNNAQEEARLRITALETASVPAATQSHSGRNDHVDMVADSSRTNGLENRLHSVEDHIGGADGLSTRWEVFQNNIGKLKEDIVRCQDGMETLQNSIIGIFKEFFDPFKASVDGKLMEHAQHLTQVHESLANLQGKVEESRRECPAATFSAPQLALIQSMVQSETEVKQDLSQLRNIVHTEAEQRNAAVEDLKRQVAAKQDIVAATQVVDVVKTAVRNLQAQYDNISTDSLHQKMVHWFMQNYSQSSANMAQLAVIQHEVTQLRKFTDVITRIPNSAQTLGSLAQIGPQLTALAQLSPATEGAPGLLAKTSESLKTAIPSFDSNHSPIVRAESLTALEKSIATLQTELKASIDNARKEFETKASKEHDQRVHAETSMNASIQDLIKTTEKGVDEREKAEQEILSTSIEMFKELEKGQMKTQSDQMVQLQKALGQLRSDLDKALNDFNDPRNKELLGWLPSLFLHVGQLQWVVEDLNQNLPKGGFKVEWNFDWKDKFPVPSPFPDSGDTAGKGKGKKQA